MADPDLPRPPRSPAPPRSPRRKRWTGPLATAALMATAGASAWLGATQAAGFIENLSRRDAALRLAEAGFHWAGVETSGLRVVVSGTAPDEVQRMRALAEVGRAVDQRRVVDEITVTATQAAAAPEFRLEVLRNDSGLSLIGLVPHSLNRQGLIARLREATGAENVTDLLQAADHPAPPGWTEALETGVLAVRNAPRAKVSITPGAVEVAAGTDDAAAKTRLETLLRRETPAGVALTLTVTAPRPVITPFTLRLVKDEAGLHFDACSAEDAEGRAAILSAATKAGVTGEADCRIGMGAPAPSWPEAAAAGIAALAGLPAGTLTLSDTDISLIAPDSVPAETFAETARNLSEALPPVFTLDSRQTAAAKDSAEAPMAVTATLRDGTLTLRGPIADARMAEAVDGLARARFGTVDSVLRPDDAAPEGWTLRVIAALEAMDGLAAGTARVTPDLVRLTGVSGQASASDEAAARLARRLGAGARYELAIRYDRRLDPALALPSGQECVDRLNRVMQESEIGFEPNKGDIAGDPKPTLDRLAKAMTDCADFRIEIGGHTDAQGSEATNAQLSRLRAQAVRQAMEEAGIPVAHLTAKGYGESQPIADNETEAGRETNRRIAFTLLAEEPINGATRPDPARVVTGVTGEPAGTEAGDRAETAPVGDKTDPATPATAEPAAERAPDADRAAPAGDASARDEGDSKAPEPASPASSGDKPSPAPVTEASPRRDTPAAPEAPPSPVDADRAAARSAPQQSAEDPDAAQREDRAAPDAAPSDAAIPSGADDLPGRRSAADGHGAAPDAERAGTPLPVPAARPAEGRAPAESATSDATAQPGTPAALRAADEPTSAPATARPDAAAGARAPDGRSDTTATAQPDPSAAPRASDGPSDAPKATAAAPAPAPLALPAGPARRASDGPVDPAASASAAEPRAADRPSETSSAAPTSSGDAIIPTAPPFLPPGDPATPAIAVPNGLDPATMTPPPRRPTARP